MKIWFDNNYSIIKTDGNSQFGQGNISFDRIVVCIPTDSVVNDNTLPQFNFLLSNGRKVGPFVHNINSTTEGEYTVFTYVLDDLVLSCAGFLQITIAINWYDSSGVVTRVRNISAVGNVVENVVIYDDILIVGSAKATIECHSDDIKALDQRLSTVSTAVIGDVSASISNNVGIPNVVVEVDNTNPRKPNVNFAFSNLKGDKGDQGIQGIQGLKGDKGDQGQPFMIKKIYSSVAEMNSSYNTDGLAVGDLVAIVSSVDDADNAKLYVKGNTAYDFLVDMSGATGIQGPRGEQGPRGDSGVTAPIASMFTLYVDENGDLYCLSNDVETPKFEYDNDTGNLYVVHDDTGDTINYANGDDLVYGSN